MAYDYDRSNRRPPARSAAYSTGTKPIELKAINPLQDLVPQVGVVLHDAVRTLIYIEDPKVKQQTAKVLVDMLELEIADYESTIRSIKNQYKV